MTDFSNIDALSDASSLVESEALAWIAQLNGDNVSEKDLAAFRSWVNRSPAHQKEIKELSELWTGLNVLTVMDEPIRQADKLSKQLRKKRARQDWRRKAMLPAFSVATILAIVAVAPTILSRNDAPTSYEAQVNVPLVFKTAKGEHQTHSLQDGSVITLNTESYVEVDFTAVSYTHLTLPTKA